MASVTAETKWSGFNIYPRTFQFGVRIVKLVDQLPRTTAGIEIGRQLLRSGTSIGANTREAGSAESHRDFVHKLSIARKEARNSFIIHLLPFIRHSSRNENQPIGENRPADRWLIYLNARKCGQDGESNGVVVDWLLSKGTY